MKVINKVSELKHLIKKEKNNEKTIGFVPTMGALHQGHLTLVEHAVNQSDITVVSIFVNPTQFSENEDLDRYPRDFDGDHKKLEEAGVDILFYPDVSEVYPNGFQTTVSLTKLTKGLCGAKRSGHFDGVATIVLKLFNMVNPDQAFFGLKDYQQFAVISQLIKDMNLDIEIKGVPIVREADGLAMSSRNLNLTSKGRERAGLINKTAREMINLYKKEKQKFNQANVVINKIKEVFDEKNIAIDYIEIRDKNTLEEKKVIDEDSMIFLAVFIDRVRLIDNFFFGE